MGRKRTLNRMDFRGDFEGEEGETKNEEEETEEEEEEGDDEEEGDSEAEADADAEGDEEAADDEDAPKPKKKAKKKAPAAPRKARTPKVVRMKAVWVIYDNSSKQIEQFPYNQRPEAEKYVEEKNTDKKGFYIQLVKVPFDEK